MSTKKFKYKVSDLLEVIKENRNNHRKVFEVALGNYQKKVIETLEMRLESAKKGERIRHSIGIQEPMDQTKEYDQIIKMLEMTVEEVIELDRAEFCQYILDQWDWKHQFVASSMPYICEGDLPEDTGHAIDV